jgi:transcriptional regulator with GAF, ATPase, and Fis domain
MAAMATPSFIRSRNRLLIASADPAFRKDVMKIPAYAESDSEEAVGGAHALAKLLQFPCDSVVLDRNLPDLDASEVAEQIRKQFPRIDVELLDSRAANRETREVQTRDTQEHYANTILGEMPAQKRALSTNSEPLPGMIGSSHVMRQLYALVRMVVGRDTTVLVTGETGTGKELIAQAIHKLSRRARHPFVVVNCAAIPESLLEAELFGHARGAFTGAVQSRLGRIHVAQGGTLFLDEIGDLPLNMQAKLLRFLENGEVQRLGSSDVYRVDVRVVCATNAPLLELVQAKTFRQDLYYRLAIFPIDAPPLRARLDDIEELAKHFLAQLSTEASLPLKEVSCAALADLRKGRWSGNVRELQHAIERAFILSGNETELYSEHFQRCSELTN